MFFRSCQCLGKQIEKGLMPITVSSMSSLAARASGYLALAPSLSASQLLPAEGTRRGNVCLHVRQAHAFPGRLMQRSGHDRASMFILRHDGPAMDPRGAGAVLLGIGIERLGRIGQ